MTLSSVAQTPRSGSAVIVMHNGAEMDIAYNPVTDTYRLVKPLLSDNLYSLKVNHEGCYYAIWFDKHCQSAIMGKRTDCKEKEDVLRFRVDEEPGIEEICILYCKKPVDINSILESMKMIPGSAIEKISRSISDKVVAWDDYRPVINRIAFSALTTREIVPIIIEFVHETQR